MMATSLGRIFTPDHQKYEGVRPINIYLLWTLYFLMAAFVGTGAWSTIVNHQGPWDHMRAVAWCVWATYTTLALLGLMHPLRMLPVMVFMIGYKLLWLGVVAYPLWRAGTLDGSAAEGMARTFAAAQLAIIAVPWGYFFRNYLMPPRSFATIAGKF